MEKPAFLIHHQDHMDAVFAAATRPVLAISPPGAAAYWGGAVFAAMTRASRTAHPGADVRAILDCGAEAGQALNALRHGVDGVVFSGHREAARRLADIAGQGGATLFTKRPEAIDLRSAPDAGQVCIDALAKIG